MKFSFGAVEFTVSVSDSEKASASLLRAALVEFSEALEEFHEFFDTFAESVNAVNDGSELISVIDSFLKYVYRMREEFNTCVLKLSVVLSYANNVYSESKTEQIKDTLVGAFDELRLAVIELIYVSGNLHAKDFKERAGALIAKIYLYMEKAVNVSHDEWISHIDKNILARIRLS